MRQRIVDSNGQLRVTLLFDYCRGSRGTVSSRSMVAPLLKEQHTAVQVTELKYEIVSVNYSNYKTSKQLKFLGVFVSHSSSSRLSSLDSSRAI